MKLNSLAIVLVGTLLWGMPLTEPTTFHASPTGFEQAMAELNIDHPVALSSGCISCPPCSGSSAGPNPHGLQQSGGQLMLFPGEPHWGVCIPSSCMENHYFDFECGSEGEDFTAEDQEALWLVATGQDTDAVMEALREFPKALKLNLEYSSIQLYNCLGEIAASIPIHPGRLAELQSALTR